jgi:hypothetical protein
MPRKLSFHVQFEQNLNLFRATVEPMSGRLSNSRFKHFPNTVNLRVESGLIAIETVSFYSHFRYSPESSTFFLAHVMARATVSEHL